MNRRNLFNGSDYFIEYENTQSGNITFIDENGVSTSYDGYEGRIYPEQKEWISMELDDWTKWVDFSNSGIHLTGTDPLTITESGGTMNKLEYMNTTNLWSDTNSLEDAFSGWDGYSKIVFGGYWPNVTSWVRAFYYNKVINIEFKENLMNNGISNFQNCSDFSYMFENCHVLQTCDFSDLNCLSGSFVQTFIRCESLRSIKFPKNFKPTNLGRCFEGCDNLDIQTVLNDLNTKDLSSLTNVAALFTSNKSSGEIIIPWTTLGGFSFDSMFAECPNITSVKIPNLEMGTSSANAIKMYYNCTNLKYADVPKVTASKTTTIERALRSCFSGCTSLETVNAFTSNTSVQSYLLRNLPGWAGGEWTNNNGILTRTS